jgi:hypothetical protein
MGLAEELVLQYGKDAYAKAIELTVAAIRRGDLAEARLCAAAARRLLSERRASAARAAPN